MYKGPGSVREYRITKIKELFCTDNVTNESLRADRPKNVGTDWGLGIAAAVAGCVLFSICILAAKPGENGFFYFPDNWFQREPLVFSVFEKRCATSLSRQISRRRLRVRGQTRLEIQQDRPCDVMIDAAECKASFISMFSRKINSKNPSLIPSRAPHRELPPRLNDVKNFLEISFFFHHL